MKKKRSAIIQFVLSMQVLIILVVSSFAWFDNTYHAQVNPFEVTVGTSNGLYIVLDGNELSASSEVNMAQLIQTTAIPVLIQSSSRDGIHFVTLDASTINTNIANYWSTASFIPAEANVHYLEFTFFLLTENTAKDIFLSEDLSQVGYMFVSTMTDSVTNPNEVGPVSTIRIAMSFNNGVPIIFGDEAENSTVGFTTKNVLTTGHNIDPYAIQAGVVETGQIVHTFSEYFLGYVEYDNHDDPIGYYTDNTKAHNAVSLYTLQANAIVPVTVRMWMEGGDIDCSSEAQILNNTINIGLKFVARDHLGS